MNWTRGFGGCRPFLTAKLYLAKFVQGPALPLASGRAGRIGSLGLVPVSVGATGLSQGISRRLLIRNSAWSRVRPHCSTVLSPEFSLAGDSSRRAITGGNGFRNSCSTTFSGITEFTVPSTECRVKGSVIWCCLHVHVRRLCTRNRPGNTGPVGPGLA